MNNTANLRRIQNEVKTMQNNGEYDNMFSIKMVGDNMYKWEAVLHGPDDSLYKGYDFKIKIDLPNDYPFSPPAVKFITPIKHVNVNDDGNICLDILKNKWAASQRIESVILSILVLLSHPCPEDPFNHDLARLYRENRDEYIRLIKQSCDATISKTGKYSEPSRLEEVD